MKKNDNLDRKRIVQQRDFKIKKKFSQNFLLDENIITNIIDAANVDETTGVIEIGPGLGALTKHLVTQAKKCLVYEIDNELIPYIKTFIGDSKNLKLLNKDVLSADINQDIMSYLSDVDRVVVISNLPYHITTPIIMKFLETVHHIDSMVLMMQLEVAKRITSMPNTKDYNALSVIIQHQTNAKYLFKVSKNVFHPKPNVDSAVIRLDIKSQIHNKDYQPFYQFIHHCFQQRRKTLVNNLSQSYNHLTKGYFNETLIGLNINPLTRAESLSLKDFELLYNRIIKDLRETTLEE